MKLILEFVLILVLLALLVIMIEYALDFGMGIAEKIEEFKKNRETLQELINNYTELVNKKCMKCRDFQIITRMDPPTILCKEKGCKWYEK